jgi:hypothetical protein
MATITRLTSDTLDYECIDCGHALRGHQTVMVLPADPDDFSLVTFRLTRDCPCGCRGRRFRSRVTDERP